VGAVAIERDRGDEGRFVLRAAPGGAIVELRGWISTAQSTEEPTLVPESGGLQRASAAVQVDTRSNRASSTLVGKEQS